MQKQHLNSIHAVKSWEHRTRAETILCPWTKNEKTPLVGCILSLVFGAKRCPLSSLRPRDAPRHRSRRSRRKCRLQRFRRHLRDLHDLLPTPRTRCKSESGKETTRSWITQDKREGQVKYVQSKNDQIGGLHIFCTTYLI